MLGVVGISREKEVAGHCYSTGLRSVVGQAFAEPIEAESLDEVVLVMRRSSGLRFDEQLPGFHFYGTSICLEAEARDMKSYIVPAFCVHNSNGVTHFPPDFWRAYFYLRREWWTRLPVRTTCTTITKGYAPFLRATVKDVGGALVGHRTAGSRSSDVARLYESLRRNQGVVPEAAQIA